MPLTSPALTIPTRSRRRLARMLILVLTLGSVDQMIQRFTDGGET